MSSYHELQRNNVVQAELLLVIFRTRLDSASTGGLGAALALSAHPTANRMHPLHPTQAGRALGIRSVFLLQRCRMICYAKMKSLYICTGIRVKASCVNVNNMPAYLPIAYAARHPSLSAATLLGGRPTGSGQ